MISLQQFTMNEVIIKENDIDEHLYLIKSGSVIVTKSLNNREIEIAKLTIGSFFGEMALIDERPRTATVTSLEETVLEVFHRDNFLALMQKDENIAVNFLSG
jgi:CRP-like cAMP-binding protein